MVSSAFLLSAQPYFVGGSAAVAAAIAIHPIDLAKLQIQLAGQYNPVVRPTFASVIKDVVAASGVKGLYSGVSAAVARQMIYGTARLGLHRAVSDGMQQYRQNQGHPGSLPGWMKGTIAASTGAVAAVLGCPMDVALVRMQAESKLSDPSKKQYKNVVQAVGKIAGEEGVATLWRGTVPLVARGAAMNFGMMASYDQSKEILTDYFNDGNDSLAIQLASSGISGFVCAFTSLPFDLIKSRLMNMKKQAANAAAKGGEVAGPVYTGFIDCGLKTVQREGVTALWRGYWTYYSRCAPNAMIVLMLVEQFNGMYRKYFHLENARK